MYLKFFFENTDGCTGTFGIAIFNENNELIDNSTIEILHDDFKADTPCSQGTFTNTPRSGKMCRKWSPGSSTLIIKINETKITKLGISTWANVSYPTERVTIYGSDNYDGPYDEICTIECDSRIQGVYTMVYDDTPYTTDTEPEEPENPEEPDNPIPLSLVPSGLNTNIYKNPCEHYLFDLSVIGTIIHEDKAIQINQGNHYFQVGDVLYYNVKTQLFGKAVAVNNIESEVCGIVSKVIDNNNFIIASSGLIETDRYTFAENTVLYLSEIQPGKLVSIEPSSVIKQIATQTTNGIIIDIQRGYRTPSSSSDEEYESYTQEELDEIIQNVW